MSRANRGSGVVELAGADVVRGFVAMLGSEYVSDAVLTHTGRPRVETPIPDDDNPGRFLTMPDHAVIVGVRGHREAVSYRGVDGHQADPRTPVPSRRAASCPVRDDEFPSRCEIPVEVLTDALIEFLKTAARPLTITWQPALE